MRAEFTLSLEGSRLEGLRVLFPPPVRERMKVSDCVGSQHGRSPNLSRGVTGEVKSRILSGLREHLEVRHVDQIGLPDSERGEDFIHRTAAALGIVAVCDHRLDLA